MRDCQYVFDSLNFIFTSAPVWAMRDGPLRLDFQKDKAGSVLELEIQPTYYYHYISPYRYIRVKSDSDEHEICLTGEIQR